jgi:hypothetical protein
VQGHLLRIDISNGPPREIERLWRIEQWPDFAFDVAFDSEGWRGRASALGTYGQVSRGREEGAEAKIVCADWSAVRVAAPRIWVGRVRGIYGCPRGNLRFVDRIGRRRRDHGEHLVIRAPGAALFLLQRRPPAPERGAGKQGQFYLVVDADVPGPLDPEVVRTWLDALSFVLGARLAVRELVGMDDDARVAGRMGILMAPGRERGFPSEPPTPMNGAGPAYMVPFFEAIVAKAAPAIWSLIPGYYLDSFEGPATEAYVKLITALEGLAKHMASGADVAGRLSLVADRTEWSNWVDAQLPVLEKLFAGRNMKSVRARLEGLSTVGDTQRVRRVFEALGLGWPDWAQAQERIWNAPRHGTVLSTEHPHRDVAHLRALLVALVAQWAGYQGPIIGGEWLRYGVLGAADPAWWPWPDASVPQYVVSDVPE